MSKVARRGGARRGFLVAIAMAALAALCAPSLAGATASHHFTGTLDTGQDPAYPSACAVHDLDVDAQGNVYVLCGGRPFFGGGAVVKKFDKDGNPVPFTAKVPYLSGNAIIENPDGVGFSQGYIEEYGQTFDAYGKLTVGTTGPAAGYMFVSQGFRIEVFEPNGRYVSSLEPAGNFGIGGMGTGPEGDFYYGSGFKVDRRDVSLTVDGQLYAADTNSIDVAPATEDLAVDSTGAFWGIGTAVPGFPSPSISRWEADQFLAPEQESEFSFGKHKVAKLSKLVDAPLRQFGYAEALQGKSLAVDRSDDSLFVERQPISSITREIVQFSRGTEAEHSHQIAAPIGSNANIGPTTPFGEEGTVQGIAVGPEGTVYAAAGPHGVSKFTRGAPLPTVRDPLAAIDDAGHTDATLRASLELAGGPPITGCEVVYGPTVEYGQSAPCDPDPSGTPLDADTPVTAHVSGLEIGQEYHYAFVATNAEGTAYGIDRSFTTFAVLNVHTEAPTDVTNSSATFNGSLNPDGLSTTYHFVYGLAGDPTDETEESPPITSGGVQPVSVPIANLGPGREYQYRLVATNSTGTTEGPVRTFRTGGPPVISGVHAEKVLSEEADLKGQVDPGGYPTTYRFEYGPTTGYGNVVPAAPGDAGGGQGNTEVSQHVEGLEAGRVYHFRLAATSVWGTSYSDDTTFNFLPEPCPNEHVRQQMKSAYLPDCRAYELVSPENVEGAQIYPGSEALVQGWSGFPQYERSAVSREIQNTGLANGPSRFSYYVGLGALGSLDAPNSGLDQYISTRTNQGWETTYSGLQGHEAYGEAGKVCSYTLDRCVDHFLNNPFAGEDERPRNSAFLFDLDGKKLGPVPTNWESVQGGERFRGEVRASPDLRHVAFSSREAVFAEGGQTASPGSAYDNDLATGSVKLISTLNSGEPIPGYDEGQYQFITFPPTGISRDGSHIVMETHAPEGMSRIYMRVNDVLLYEIGESGNPGEPAPSKFIGMTNDGSRLLFLTKQSLLPEDSDTSADIYMWHEKGGPNGEPSLTLVSQNGSTGSGDACKASWTERCSVELLETEAGDRSGYGNRPGESPYGEMENQDIVFGGTDSKFSSETGAVFFFSPESLAGSAPRNGKNLYVANEGEIHYVTTVGGAQTIDRIQISPDGAQAGFLTRARITGYENEGFEEMYSYSAAGEVLNCVSCLPTGQPPTVDVEASLNGPFMSDDGRLFFSTSDPLVPADADPYSIPDVYEYTQGRPQLISTGTSSNGKAPGGAASFTAEPLGLESVSSNGQDVFFSTTDTMVPQDSNGHFAKIYDARTNGGFAVAENPAPCVAADECHGAGSSNPVPYQVGTGSPTTGGNALGTTPGHKKHKAKKHKKKHGAKKHRGHRRHGGNR